MSSAGVIPVVQPSAAPELALADIQGVVLRSYRMPFLRALVLRIVDAPRARAFLQSLADGAPHSMLKIQTAEVWDTRPQSCLNLGITAEGLRALELPPATLATFPPEFIEGAISRAAMVGDVGINDPANWMPAFSSDANVHIVLFLSAASSE